MFFHVTLERTLHLHPRFFGPRLRATLINKLNSEVEGTCSGQHGFIVIVTNVDDIGMGKVRDGTPLVSFPVKFKAVVFRPFRNEVLDAVVSQITKKGFFAEAGPLQIFVSETHLPVGVSFDETATPPQFTSSDARTRIGQGDSVRLRIIGSRVDAHEIFCVGSLNDDYLGVLS